MKNELINLCLVVVLCMFLIFPIRVFYDDVLKKEKATWKKCWISLLLLAVGLAFFFIFKSWFGEQLPILVLVLFGIIGGLAYMKEFAEIFSEKIPGGGGEYWCISILIIYLGSLAAFSAIYNNGEWLAILIPVVLLAIFILIRLNYLISIKIRRKLKNKN